MVFCFPIHQKKKKKKVDKEYLVFPGGRVFIEEGWGWVHFSYLEHEQRGFGAKGTVIDF